MKKTVLLILSFVIFLAFPFFVFAQTFNSDKAYSDYQFSLTVYYESYSSYQNSRDAFLKNQTLTLKEDARKKTLQMLRDRDQLEIVYITALRTKISETTGLNSDEKNAIFGKIDDEVNWYQIHKGNYKDDDSLETLFNKSAEAESRYKNDTGPKVYESLFLISLGTEIGIKEDQEKIYASLRAVIDSGISGGKLNMDPFNRWYTDIDSIFQNIKQNEDLARTQIQEVYTQNYSTSGSYDTSIATLTSSKKLLSQLNDFLMEVLVSIKNQI
jgi:hypothetical protein